jgi:hypothetical protein
MIDWKYLKPTKIGFILDHRLTPEVRALFAAMASRMPDGGIEARYRQVMGEIAKHLVEEAGYPPPHASDPEYLGIAESMLTEYPLHPVVQEFFAKFVKNYGHSSILELTGSPGVYVQGVSPFTAYLSFDNPLVKGQEFSTRAVRRKDWPMAREAMILHTAYKLSDNEGTAVDHYPVPKGSTGDAEFHRVNRNGEYWQERWEPHPELTERGGALAMRETVQRNVNPAMVLARSTRGSPTRKPSAPPWTVLAGPSRRPSPPASATPLTCGRWAGSSRPARTSAESSTTPRPNS